MDIDANPSFPWIKEARRRIGTIQGGTYLTPHPGRWTLVDVGGGDPTAGFVRML